MKVLHYSDIGDKRFLDLYRESDVLVTTGDLHLGDFSGLEIYEPKIPSFGVYGNHDDGCNYLEQNNIIDVHNTVVEFKGLKIGGLRGCLKYNNREMQYTEEEAALFADTFPYVDILILHAAPYGLLDDPSDIVHIGSKSIRRYVDEKKPQFVFCGHQYSNEDMQYNSTKLFRSYGARIINIDL